MIILICLALAIVPAILFPFILYLLSSRSNDGSAILKLFFTGVIVIIPAFLCSSLIDNLCFDYKIDKWSGSIVLLKSINEECLKLIGALLVIYKFKLKFNSWHEAVLIGFALGSGFNFTENFFFIWTYIDSFSLMDLIYTRTYMIGLPHPLYTAFSVLALFFLYKHSYFLAGCLLLLPVIMHFYHNMNIVYEFNTPVSAIYIVIYIGIVAIFAYEKYKPDLSYKEDA